MAYQVKQALRDDTNQIAVADQGGNRKKIVTAEVDLLFWKNVVNALSQPIQVLAFQREQRLLIVLQIVYRCGLAQRRMVFTAD